MTSELSWKLLPSRLQELLDKIFQAEGTFQISGETLTMHMLHEQIHMVFCHGGQLRGFFRRMEENSQASIFKTAGVLYDGEVEHHVNLQPDRGKPEET